MYEKATSTSHTESSENPWWEVDLKNPQPVDRVVIWNRTDNELGSRLKEFRVALLDEKRQVVWDRNLSETPNPSKELSVNGSGAIEFVAAIADTNQAASDLKAVISAPDKGKK